ncbi:MAG: [Fe-Fe] hydrogenase large subunit C-terminal domain-containing protein, partial [Clostridiales bacterium]
NFCEHYYPEFIPNLSSCKSPQQMFGAIAKSWYAKEKGIDPKDIIVVGIMPCTAKKFEITRDEDEKIKDVDISITTRELSRLIKRAGLNFQSLPDEDFDAPLGTSTGAGVIFGATGGVMEAALRTAYEWLTKETLENIEFEAVRGTEGIKRATVNVAGLDVKVAIVSGLANAKTLLDAILAGEESYHFIEIMACPGGCVNGGGQPIQPASVRNYVDLKAKRAEALYNADKDKEVRKSHDNPMIKKLYDEFLEKPGSHIAHDLLHTHYVERDRF